jgi:hypothetical protein
LQRQVLQTSSHQRQKFLGESAIKAVWNHVTLIFFFFFHIHFNDYCATNTKCVIKRLELKQWQENSVPFKALRSALDFTQHPVQLGTSIQFVACLLGPLPTYFLEQSPSWEASRFTAN